MDGSFLFIKMKGAKTMENAYKEVYFGEYCKNCKYWEKKENETPCDECLENPVNLYSHKPVNYKEKE